MTVQIRPDELIRILKAEFGYSGGGGPAFHTMLSAVHTDSVANAVTRGSLIYGNATPAWDELNLGGITGSLLTRSATDALWSGYALSGTAGQTYTFPAASASIPGGSGAANHIAYWSAADTLAHDVNQLYWDAANNRMGLGTNAPTVPLHIKYQYPVINLETTADAYPAMQLLPYQHDLAAILFDCFWDFTAGGYISSDAGSNFRIIKNTDLLTWGVRSGIAAGGAIASFTTFLVGDTSGQVGVGGRLTNPAPDAPFLVQGDGATAGLRLRRVNNAPVIGHIEGELYFSWGDTLGGRLNYGSIRGVIDAVGTDGSMQFRVLDGAVETEKMRIDQTGVGIGTTSPDRWLHTEYNLASTGAMAYAARLSRVDNTIGALAANDGVGLEFELETATNLTNLVAGAIGTAWSTAAAATATSYMPFSLINAGGALTEYARLSPVGFGINTAGAPLYRLHIIDNINAAIVGEIDNPNAGAGAVSLFRARNDSDGFVQILIGGSGVNTTTYAAFANRACLASDSTGIADGVGIAARKAASDIRFYTSGVATANERARITDSLFQTPTIGRIVNTTRVAATPYAVLATDDALFIDTDGGAITVNLPAGIDGTRYSIRNCGSSGNAVTVNPNGAETIYGGASLTIYDGEVYDICFESTEHWR